MKTPEEIDRLYRDGMAAIRAGDKTTGKEKLMQVVEADQLHEQAWLWLSACVDTDEERIVCLQNVLTINPENESARRGLEKLGAPPPEETAPPPPPTPASPPLTPPVQAEPPAPPPASALPPDEQWRAKLVEEAAGSATYKSEALLVHEEDHGPTLDLFDLVSAWLNAMIFKIIGPYDREVQYGPAGHILVNIGLAVILQMLAAVGATLVMLVSGRTPNSFFAPVIESINGLLTTLGRFQTAGLIPAPFRPAFEYFGGMPGSVNLPRLSPEVVASFGTIFLLYLVVTVLFTFVGLMIQAMITNATAEWLGGKGRVIQTTMALTIALVVTRIVELPFWFIFPLAPAVVVWLLLALQIYQFLQMSNAVNAAHKLGLFASMGAVIIAGVLMGILASCLSLALALIMR